MLKCSEPFIITLLSSLYDLKNVERNIKNQIIIICQQLITFVSIISVFSTCSAAIDLSFQVVTISDSIRIIHELLTLTRIGVPIQTICNNSNMIQLLSQKFNLLHFSHSVAKCTFGKVPSDKCVQQRLSNLHMCAVRSESLLSARRNLGSLLIQKSIQ